jgi:hypothetical protein
VKFSKECHGLFQDHPVILLEEKKISASRIGGQKDIYAGYVLKTSQLYFTAQFTCSIDNFIASVRSGLAG